MVKLIKLIQAFKLIAILFFGEEKKMAQRIDKTGLNLIALEGGV